MLSNILSTIYFFFCNLKYIYIDFFFFSLLLSVMRSIAVESLWLTNKLSIHLNFELWSLIITWFTLILAYQMKLKKLFQKTNWSKFQTNKQRRISLEKNYVLRSANEGKEINLTANRWLLVWYFKNNEKLEFILENQ